MKYKAVFWDIDGTMYDNSRDIPDDEKEILSRWKKLEAVPDRQLSFWVPYDGLAELMEQISQVNQGVISNDIHHLQNDKLLLLGLVDYINPELIFTSYGEAEKVLDTPNHPLLKGFNLQSDRDTDVHNMELRTQKPETYMFERALQTSGYAPEDCVMIGDDWKDVLGAQKVGMKAIYISGLNQDEFFDPIAKGKITPDYTVQKGNIQALTDLLI